MYMIKLFGAVMLTMAVGAVASPLLGEDIFAREEEDPDCCGTGYSISVCSDTAACSGYSGACCPVVFNGPNCYPCSGSCDSDNGYICDGTSTT